MHKDNYMYTDNSSSGETIKYKEQTSMKTEKNNTTREVNNMTQKTIKRIGGIVMLVALFLTSHSYAQATGAITGKILDAESGEGMIGATAYIREANVSGVASLDGTYYISNVPPGTHKVIFQMAGYQTAADTVTVAPGQTVSGVNVALSYRTAKEVVVKAKRISNTAASMLSKRKKAAAAQDAISAEQISKSPDSNAADAAKRVTGVTIVGGDTVYVRGLGERYSGVMFAGSAVPSPNPDKRVVPLSIFPVGVLDNIIISKTYTADMPGEFGGGIVQINPKDFPGEMSAKASIGTGYHSLTTFKDFSTYNGGKYDWAGIDDGTRKLPETIRPSDQVGTTFYTNAELDEIESQLPHQYTPQTEKGLMPLSLSAEFGNSYKFSKTSQMGIIASGMFKESSKNRTTEFVSHTGTQIEKNQKIEESVYSTNKGGLLSISYSPAANHKLRATNFYTHQSDKEASTTEGFYRTFDYSDDIQQFDLRFVEETLLFNQLDGKHSFKMTGEPVLNWTATYARATRDEPHRTRLTLADDDAGDYRLEDPSGNSEIFYQQHDENVYNGDASVDFYFKQWNGLKSKLTAGGGYLFRERDSLSRTFNYTGATNVIINKPFEQTIPSALDAGTVSIDESSANNNSYRGELTVFSGYGSVDMPLIPKLRLIAGLRYENAVMNLISFNPVTGSETGLADNPLNENQLLPTANLVYEVNNNFNIRTAFSKTISRPDFREVSEFRYTLMSTQEQVQGNPELVETDIYNGDIRFEWFPSAAEIIALSLFYKNLQNPIEIVQQNGGENLLFSYENAKKADNMGVELEIRKNLEFLHESVKDFTFSSNLAFIYSQIDVSGLETNYTNDKRALQGQSPYVLNVGLDYENEALGITNTILYNRYGRRIVSVGLEKGGAEFGDIYEEPVDRLDYVIKKSFDYGGSLKLTIANILNPKIEQTQKINEGQANEVDYTTEVYRAGVSYSISYSQKF